MQDAELLLAQLQYWYVAPDICHMRLICQQQSSAEAQLCS